MCVTLKNITKHLKFTLIENFHFITTAITSCKGRDGVVSPSPVQY